MFQRGPIHKTPVVMMVSPPLARLTPGLLARLVQIPRPAQVVTGLEILARLARIPNGEDAMNGARTIPVRPDSLFNLHSRTVLQLTLMILQVH